jgi:arsenite-transporting ATPase
VFQAFARIIREADTQFVVMDTAPTGHSLLLLDATGAYHREAARQMRKDEKEIATPLMQLQNVDRTKVLIVTLPENTPVQEASSLQDDLRRAGIEPWGWIINNSFAATGTKSQLLRRRAMNEIPHIETVLAKHAKRTALVPMKNEEPVGIERLLNLSTQ